MARLIEFHVPADFQKPRSPWVPAEQRGRVIEMKRTAQSTDDIAGQLQVAYFAAAAPSPIFPR